MELLMTEIIISFINYIALSFIRAQKSKNNDIECSFLHQYSIVHLISKTTLCNRLQANMLFIH